MNLEELTKRLELIEQSLKQTIGNFNLLEGQKHECLHWIKQLKEPEKEPEKELPIS